MLGFPRWFFYPSQCILTWGARGHFRNLFFHYKFPRRSRCSLFKAGSKCLLGGIVRFRINQSWRKALVRATWYIGFEFWLHEETDGRTVRLPRYIGRATPKQLNMNQSRGKKQRRERRSPRFFTCFATRVDDVLTSPYPSVDLLTRGFVRLR